MPKDNETVEPKAGPPCYKCKAATLYRTRIADPVSSKRYDLYGCTACNNLTFVPVEAD